VVRINVKGILAHKRRFAGTFLAVFLGVAFLCGTLVLSDTLRSNFDELFTSANAGTDAVVRGATKIDAESRGAPMLNQRGLISASLVDRLRSIDGVAAAAPSVDGYAQIVGKDGKTVGGNGPPRRAAAWIADPDLTPYRIAEGRAPRADDEVVINRAAAKDGGLRVGDKTLVQTPDPVRVTIVGIATWGSSDGFGKATYTAFTVDGAQRYVTKKPGEVSSIALKAAPGVTQGELVRRIQPALPGGVEAITGERLTAETRDDLSGRFLNLFETFLLVFAGVALLVATFSIYNTFSIILAQRSRESALLRAIGAARGQILGSVVFEALLVGVLASVAGLFGGLVIAGLLKGLFDSFGFALPASGLSVTATTALVSLTGGVAVTVLAALVPALKASRVPPLAALRETAVDRSGASPVRAVLGIGLSAAGVALVLTAVVRGGSGVLIWAGAGAVLTMFGVVVFGPVVARAAGAAIGAPLPRLRGVSGALARQNAMRSPRRTAGTAAALMVGVGVLTLFTVFAASLKASVAETVQNSFGGDLTIGAASFGGSGLSPRLAADVGKLPEVRTSTGLGMGAALVDGDAQQVAVADPAELERVLDLDVAQGSIADLDKTRIGVSEQAAEDNGWRIGSVIPFRFSDGSEDRLAVGAIYRTRDVTGDYVLSRAAWAPHAAQDVDSLVLIKLADGVSLPDGKAAVETVAKAYGGPAVEDRDEYAASVTQGVDTMLGIVYVLLALAIVIALMGIANTLSLAVHERTRELGLLRAVGQTRAQVRSMVRWESVIIALFGTVGGLGLGIFLGWALVQAAMADTTGAFAAPFGQLAIVLIAGALAGVLAGFRPARRAARLGVLQAIAAE
jgi:putative ABC transport system permease protein